MSKHPEARRDTAGNALIYVLIALALLAALTMVMSRQNEQASGQDISSEQAEIYAAKLIAYAASAKNIADQMVDMGTTPNQIDFVKPNVAAFSTAPNLKKIYHPDGGGLVYQQPDPKIFPTQSTGITPGWYFARFNNVEWTPTTANEVLLTAYRIDKAVCAAINVKITGNATIPTVPNPPANYLLGTLNGASTDTSLTKTDCPACEGYPTMCISNAAATDFAFYNIIEAQ